MKNPNIKIGDLVKLEGLEKPSEGIVKVQLGKNGERANQLGERMSKLAGNVENHGDVEVAQVSGLVEGLKKALVKELSPEKAVELVGILRVRFENRENMGRRHPGIEWENVQAKLEASPEKLWSLNEMEITGGEPDVVGWDEKTGEYIFIDCSEETPIGRRNCAYDREAEEKLKELHGEKSNSNAVSMAALMGVDLLSKSEYLDLLTKGEFDSNSGSWIKTPLEKRKVGNALVGGHGGLPYVGEHSVGNNYEDRGFRALLRV